MFPTKLMARALVASAPLGKKAPYNKSLYVTVCPTLKPATDALASFNP